MDKAVNKKEYLKKYLAGSGDHKKRRKVASSKSLAKSHIIDDDLDFNKMKPIDDNDIEIYGLGEDAPQIAGIIDERPDEVRIMSEYRETKKWKIVTREYEDVNISEVKGSDSDFSPPRGMTKSKEITVRREHKKKKEDTDSDVSVKRKNAESYSSPPRKSLKTSKRKEAYVSDDPSPPRRHTNMKAMERRSGDDSDVSPPRRRRHDSSDSDISPPRIRKPNQARVHSKSLSRTYRDQHEIKNRGYEKARSAGLDEPRKYKHMEKSSKRETSKMTKTLEGKKAGLQDAGALKEEVAEIRRQQAQSLAQLGDELSGRGASAIFRDKKTGRKRDLREEARQRREREEKDAEVAAKYAIWGKGMKQVDDKESKLRDDLHEMSKPLARYADDEDLDDMLRNEEKEGDPMLDYIRSKSQKCGTSKSRPQYQGSYLPNRYNIKPGYRWDGVDRSNGYEKRYFEEMSSRKAREEEAFKWSTEDM